MTRRGGYAKGDLSKETILDAAVELFGLNGYMGTSLRDVAKHAGLTHSGLLHHFPNKVALLTGVIERKDKKDHESATAQGNTEMFSKDAFLNLMSGNQQRPEVTRLFLMLAAEATNPDNPGREYFIDRYQWVRGIIMGMMQSSQGAGLMRSDVDPELTARMMMALMDGIQLQWLMNKDQQGEDGVALDVMAEFFKILGIDSDVPSQTTAQDSDGESIGG